LVTSYTNVSFATKGEMGVRYKIDHNSDYIPWSSAHGISKGSEQLT